MSLAVIKFKIFSNPNCSCCPPTLPSTTMTLQIFNYLVFYFSTVSDIDLWSLLDSNRPKIIPLRLNETFDCWTKKLKAGTFWKEESQSQCGRCVAWCVKIICLSPTSTVQTSRSYAGMQIIPYTRRARWRDAFTSVSCPPPVYKSTTSFGQSRTRDVSGHWKPRSDEYNLN